MCYLRIECNNSVLQKKLDKKIKLVGPKEYCYEETATVYVFDLSLYLIEPLTLFTEILRTRKKLEESEYVVIYGTKKVDRLLPTLTALLPVGELLVCSTYNNLVKFIKKAQKTEAGMEQDLMELATRLNCTGVIRNKAGATFVTNTIPILLKDNPNFIHYGNYLTFILRESYMTEKANSSTVHTYEYHAISNFTVSRTK